MFWKRRNRVAILNTCRRFMLLSFSFPLIRGKRRKRTRSGSTAGSADRRGEERERRGERDLYVLGITNTKISVVFRSFDLFSMLFVMKLCILQWLAERRCHHTNTHAKRLIEPNRFSRLVNLAEISDERAIIWNRFAFFLIFFLSLFASNTIGWSTAANLCEDYSHTGTQLTTLDRLEKNGLSNSTNSKQTNSSELIYERSLHHFASRFSLSRRFSFLLLAECSSTLARKLSITSQMLICTRNIIIIFMYQWTHCGTVESQPKRGENENVMKTTIRWKC